MYEACNTLSGIPTRIVCLVILLSLSLPSNATNVASQMSLSRERKITRDVPYKEAASWKRMTRSESKVNVQRLYDAYRQRFRKESDESEEEDIGGDMKELLTNEKVEDINDKADIKSQLHLNSPTTINTDEEEDSDNKENIETDLQSTQKETQLNSSPGTKADDLKSIKKENQVPLAGTSTESKVKAVEVKKKPEIQSPAVSGMVIMKLDGHPHVGIASTKALPAQAGFEQQLDETDRQIAELNRIYHEMMNSFQKTLPNSTGKSSMTKPVHLSAFTQLINIFKRLAHTDLVGEIAKKINDEMELEAQPILENTQDVSLVATNNSPMSLNQMGQWEIKDTDDINKLFDRMDPRRASSVFKRVANEMKVVRPLIKSGGLYDEYKKRLSKILKEQKYPRQSVTSDPIESESSQKLIKKATETQLREGREKPNKSSAKHNNYLKALETYIQTNRESQLNGGIKPYYLPNSKNRQLVWNEVPLLKPKNGDSPKKSSQKSEALGLKEDHKKPTTYNLYPGIEPQQIDSGVKALKHSSFFSLLDEYEKQINDINRALQAKQRWWKDALPKDDPNRGNAQGFLPSKGGQLTSCLRESPERAFVSSNTFPGVLLDLPAGMSSPQPIGGNVIDNLASQMKLSPLELAQRIATAANSATGQNMQGMGMVMASTPPPPQAATVAR
ncbi:myb-like protein X isoform X2 [Drosophila tropicalis]|uniref:myb-like protein X isoform X2 n=1 Tax=Drosophila tropicalis TaxID=46794 RepID=UPI0035AC162A